MTARPSEPTNPSTAAERPAAATWSAGSLPTALMDHRRRATELHLRFLTQQRESHEHFLRASAQAERTLLHVLGFTDHLPRPTSEAGTGVPSSPSGPRFDRGELERLAAGRVTEVFGPAFTDHAAAARHPVLPSPPLLLLDRITGLDAAPGFPGTGTVWSQTEVRADSWFLDPAGRVSAGLTMETGQGILVLLSWLGAVQGGRVPRLLDEEVTFHGSPPTAGETLSCEVRITGHTEYGGVQLFFAEADYLVEGTVRLTVRAGRLGLFTAAGLASPPGSRWDPADVPPDPDSPLDSPPLACSRRRFDAQAVRALAEGRPADCFGPGWEITRAHVRTPRISAGPLLLLGEVASFDPSGGPWGRGYLRARTPVAADDWFFAKHFPGDPCMPAGLMFDGCLQAMAFYLTAMGVTLDRDGWRFEPVPDRPCRISCRAQVTPDNRELTYEVFVRELSTAGEPTLVADVLCTVDGVKAFHIGEAGLRLVRDWPLNHWRQLGPPTVQQTGEPVPLPRLGGLVGLGEDGQAAEIDGIRFGPAAMLTSAWGRPTDILPASHASLVDDIGARRLGRLPGPPYLFVSRVRHGEGTPREIKVGTWMEAEYDVPERAWYFDQNGCPVMPFAVLLEILMQPCGLLSTFVGSVSDAAADMFYRNLDGTGVVTAQVRPGTRSLRTRVELRSSAKIGETVIQTFAISCAADGEPVFTGSAAFGFFPKWAFNHQPGLPPSDAERARLSEPCDFSVDLRRRPARYFGRPLRLAGPMLLMLDRVTGFWPDGGTAGLGRLRAELDVDADAWYFKAHFFEDPVQPGSLGNEAICQLLQFFLIETGAADGIPNPRFEPVMLNAPVTWKYRGQVLPTDQRVTIDMDILATGDDEQGRFARAEAWLWVDGRRVYHLEDIGMRVVSGTPAETSAAEVEHVLDLATDTWLADHRPIWTVAALPMMTVADMVARAASDYLGADVTALRDLRILRWIPVTGSVRLRTRVERAGADVTVTLLAEVDTEQPTPSQLIPVATGIACPGSPGERPEPFEPLTGLKTEALPYETADMFHGPAFHYLTSWQLGSTGASGVIDAARGRLPRGCLRPGLLDAMTHVIPHKRLWHWTSNAKPGRIAFPSQLRYLRVFEPLPTTGELEVEARFAGFEGDGSVFPVFDLQLCRGGRVLAAMRLVEALIPTDVFARLSPLQQCAFLRDHEYVDGFGLSTTTDGTTVVSAADIGYPDLFPGSVDALYRLPDSTAGPDRLARIAIADHVARAARVHPSNVEISEDLRSAHVIGQPDQPHYIAVTYEPGRATVHDRHQQAPR